MPDGYLRCEGRLRGCPVEIHAVGKEFLAVKILERRGIFMQGEVITIGRGELRSTPLTDRAMFNDLPVGKRSASLWKHYSRDSGFEGKADEIIYSDER